jgi:hypothetical protein
VRCHLGVGPQERTAEEHTTRGRCTTLATCGRGILGGTVSRGWSLSTVPCEGGMCPVRTLMMNASQRRSSTSCSLGSMDVARVAHSATNSQVWRAVAAEFLELCPPSWGVRASRVKSAAVVVARRGKTPLLPPPPCGGARFSDAHAPATGLGHIVDRFRRSPSSGFSHSRLTARCAGHGAGRR